jgi:DNA-binding transcriptional MerR regulator
MVRFSSAQNMLEAIAVQSFDAETQSREVYRIGDLAREFSVSLRTLRFYEDRGLITPQRSGSTRLYSAEDRKRLQIILLAKNVGFSLVDIQEILSIYDEESAPASIARIDEKFKQQLNALMEQREELDLSISSLKNAIEILHTPS